MAAPAKLLYEDVGRFSPQPSGGGSEPSGEVQPSARGRLRAADPFRDRCRSACRDTCFSRAEACEAHACLPKPRAFAAESCGPPRYRANRFSGRSLRSARVDRCGPPLREASARRTNVRFMFRTQLAKHTQRAASARQWLRHRNRARRPNTLFRAATALFDSATTDSEEYLLHLSVETNR